MNAATQSERRQLAGSFWLHMAIVLGVLLLAGCASIVTGGKQTITVQSTPSDAFVKIDGQVLGRTPLTTQIDRKERATLTIEKDGYKTVTSTLSTAQEPWIFGNALAGLFGFFGTSTDAASGAMYRFEPDIYIIALEPTDATGVSAMASKSRQQEAREFIMLSYRQIMADLAAGSGEYLDSLTGLLAVPADSKAEAVSKLRGLAAAYTSIPDFAQHAVTLYLPPESERPSQPPAARMTAAPEVAKKSPGQLRLTLIPYLRDEAGRHTDPGKDIIRMLRTRERDDPRLQFQPLPEHFLGDLPEANRQIWSGGFTPEPNCTLIAQITEQSGTDLVLTYMRTRVGFDTKIFLALCDLRTQTRYTADPVISNYQQLPRDYDYEPRIDKLFSQVDMGTSRERMSHTAAQSAARTAPAASTTAAIGMGEKADDSRSRIGLIPPRVVLGNRYNPTRDVPKALQGLEAKFPKMKVALLSEGERRDAAGNVVKLDGLWIKPSIFSRPEPDRAAVLLAAKSLELDFAFTYYWEPQGYGEQGQITMFVFDVKRELVFEEQFNFELQIGPGAGAVKQIESNMEKLFRKHRLFEER